MMRLTILAGFLALALAFKSPVRAERSLVGRRAALSAGASALVAGALSANAYDAIPTVDTNFAEMEAKRKEREEVAKKKTASLVKALKPVEAARNEADFIKSADDLALWVIGEGSIPEGMGVKTLVRRITLAYDDLPKRSYQCERTRDNNGICYSPGRGAELAYEALIKQIRKYSVIQLGDYRRVEFQAF